MENQELMQRDIDIVTSEIILLKNQAQSMAISFAIEIGKKLIEAKALLNHGEWGEWLENKVQFSQRSANDFMKIYEEYGSAQTSLFSSNSQALANLSYTKVLKLLVIPKEERDSFVEENNVDEISTRELEKMIKERNEALKAKDEAERRAEQYELAQERASKAEKEIAVNNQKVSDLNNQIEALQLDLEKRKEAEKKAKAKIKDLKENPTIPQELLNKIQSETEAKAAEKAAENIEKQTAELKKQLEAAENEKKQAEQEALDAQRKIKELNAKVQLADPDVIEFKRLFQQTQENMQKLTELSRKIAVENPDLSAKFNLAIATFAKKYDKEF